MKTTNLLSIFKIFQLPKKSVVFWADKSNLLPQNTNSDLVT